MFQTGQMCRHTFDIFLKCSPWRFLATKRVFYMIHMKRLNFVSKNYLTLGLNPQLHDSYRPLHQGGVVESRFGHCRMEKILIASLLFFCFCLSVSAETEGFRKFI